MTRFMTVIDNDRSLYPVHRVLLDPERGMECIKHSEISIDNEKTIFSDNAIIGRSKGIPFLEIYNRCESQFPLLGVVVKQKRLDNCMILNQYQSINAPAPIVPSIIELISELASEETEATSYYMDQQSKIATSKKP